MLAAYGEILLGNNNLSGVVPQISLVLGPCLGTSAMIAASADIVVMTKKAQLTIDTTGKDGTAEDAAKLGHLPCGGERRSGGNDAGTQVTCRFAFQ